MKKLNLCCGTNNLPPPWENHDIDVDITKKLPWEDNGVSYVLIEHGLEHVTPQQGLAFLVEVYRVLAPGGVLRVCVPQLKRLNVKDGRDIVFNHGHAAVYNEQLLREFLRLAGFDPIAIVLTSRKEVDGHWKVIGKEKDDLETLRMEAMKI